MARLNITYRNISDLRPRARNPRTHTRKQIEQIAASIRRFGFTNPVLIDSDDGVVAGHGRLEAARLLGMAEVPALRLGDLGKADVRAYVIADNRLAEKAGWDRDLLGLELKYLAELDFDFDLTLTGFDLPEIDALISGTGPDEASPDPADEVPKGAGGPAVTRPGDIWQIGRHRLICGDTTEAGTYSALLGGRKTGMVFTEPTEIDRTLIGNIVRARKWYAELCEGKIFTDIAKLEGTSKRRVQDIVDLTFLSPELLQQIVAGTHSAGLTTDSLIKNGFPVIWADQQAAFAELD